MIKITKSIFLVPVWKIVAVLLATIYGGSVIAEAKGAPKACSGKRLVVLAGPRRSATSSVAEFFYKYARGTQANHAHGKTYFPLKNFRWPLVYGEVSNQTETEMPYKRFNKLVTDQSNKPLMDEILESIRRDFELSETTAVIFGGEEFDQVGLAAHNGYDAIKAVQGAVEITGVAPECVDIILNYRTPRFEHWVSLYSSLTVKGESNNQFLPYEEHMCDDDDASLRLEELGTTMNPMYLAEVYLEAGWNVKMIDMGGVEAYGSDISHTIACEILHGKCDKEKRWVNNHKEETINNKVLEKEIDSLPKKDESESLFRYRDCAYQQDLRSNGRFQVIQNKTIWHDCQRDDKREWIYQSLRTPKGGTRLVFAALLSEVDCYPFGGFPAAADGVKDSDEIKAAKIEDFLSGHYQEHHDIFEWFEDEVKDGSFSTPLIMVVVLFAGGIGFYMMKVKENPEYTMPVFDLEMNGIGDMISSGANELTSRMSQMRSSYKDQDSSSESGDSDDSDDDDDDDGDDDFEDESPADFI